MKTSEGYQMNYQFQVITVGIEKIFMNGSEELVEFWRIRVPFLYLPGLY